MEPPQAIEAAGPARPRPLPAWPLHLLGLGLLVAGVVLGKLVLMILFVAATLALILDPVVRLLARIRLPRSVGALVAVLLFWGAVVAVGWLSLGRVADFADELPTYSANVQRGLRRLKQRMHVLEQTTGTVLPTPDDRTRTVAVSSERPSWIGLLRKLGPASEFLLAISFVPFLTYFMLTWQGHFRSGAMHLFPAERQAAAEQSLAQVARVLRRFMLGNLLTGLLLGVPATIVCGIVGVPFFYFVGFLSGFLNIVPYLGVVLAPLPPLLLGLGSVGTTGALVVLGTSVALHLVAVNLVYPRFVGRALQLNPLSGTLALLCWAWLWGPLGLLFGIPLTAAIKIVCDHVESLRPWGALLGPRPIRSRSPGTDPARAGPPLPSRVPQPR